MKGNNKEYKRYNNNNNMVDNDSPCNKKEKHSKYDSLSCWLWKLKVAIPNQTFHDGIFSLNIQSMMCSNFSIQSLEATTSPSSNTTINPTLSISVDNVSSTCSGTYSSALIGGSVSAMVQSVPDTPMNMKLILLSNVSTSGYKMAAGISIPSCQSDVTIPKDQLIFSGSISAYIINLFSNHISAWISTSLSSQICPLTTPQLETNVNQSLGRIDEYMLELIHNFTTNSSSEDISDSSGSGRKPDVDSTKKGLKDNGELVTWDKDLVFVSNILNQSNQFLSHYLNKGILTDLLPNQATEEDDIVQEAHFSSCNNGFLSGGVNGYIQNITNGSAFYSLPSLINHTKTIPAYGNITVRIHNISVQGIDQFENVTLFQPRNENSLFTRIKTASDESEDASGLGLNVTFGCSIRVDPIQGGSIQGDPLEESFELGAEMSQVDILSQLDFAIKRYHLDQLYLGNIMSFPSSSADFKVHWPCLVSILDSIHWTNIEAHLDLNHIMFQSLDNDTNSTTNTTDDARQLERDLDDTIQTIVNLFIGEYTPFVSDAILGFSHGPLNAIFNYASSMLLYEWTHDSSGNYSPCSPYKPNAVEASHKTEDDDDQYIHLDESVLPQWINYVLFGQNHSSIAAVNQWMECAEELVVQQINPADSICSFQIGHLNIDLRHPMFSNFDTFSYFDVLQPEIDHYHLLNQFLLGQEHNESKDDISSSFFLTLQDNSTNGFKANMHFNLSFSDLHTTAGTTIKYDKNQFSSLSVSKFANHSQCIYAPASSEFQLYSSNSSISITQVDMSLDVIWSNTNHNASNSNSTWNVSGVGPVTNFANTLISFIIPFGIQRTNEYIHENTIQGSDVCYNDYSQHSDEYSTLTQVFFGFVLMFHVLMFIVFLIMYVKKKQTSDETLDPSLTQPLLDSNEKDDTTNNVTMLNTEDETMHIEYEFMEGISDDIIAMDEDYPPILLTDIPISSALFILVNILFVTVLFISSNVSIGASIDIVVSSAYGTTRTIPSISTFSLVDSLRDMSQAGVYFLFVIVLFFSGIWPYVKLLLMSFACIATSDYLSKVNRERLLVTLDALGKYSLVDSFFLFITIVACRYHLEWVNIGSFDVLVSTKYGGYSFIIATIMSLILGHFILYNHRYATNVWSPGSSIDNEVPKESLIAHIMKKHGRRNSVLWIVEFLIILFCFYTAAFLIVGVTTNTFTIEIKGLAGYLLKQHSITNYSIISFGKSIASSTGDNGDTFGVHFLAAIYFFFVAAMPFTCLLLLMTLLFIPMSVPHQQFVLVSTEIANAWNALDVFVITILAAVFQISKFSSFVIGDKCDAINGLLETFLDDNGDVDDVCYDIHASLTSNALFLIIGVVFHLILTNFILKYSRSTVLESSSDEPKGYYAVLEDDEDDGFQDIEEEFLLYRN